MDFKVRPARSSDKDALMTFIRNVWGGHDYIPRVWDEWIGDRSARMFVVETEGRPVALNRVKFLEDGSAWFEGVRVHPDYRGMGLATMLGQNSMKIAREKGATTFRLTSSSWNHPAHRQVARMKFAELSRIGVYDASKGARFRRQKGVKVATPADLAVVAGLIRGTKEFKTGSGVMWDGFSAVSLTGEVLANRVREGSVLYGDGAVAIAKPGREGKLAWTQVCFVGGEPVAAARLVRHAFAARGTGWRFVVVPRASPVIGPLRRAGLKRSFSLILFERKSAKG